MREESETASPSFPPAQPQTPFDRCLVDGDQATASSRRRRRGKALGISFLIETALLASVIAVPFMTNAALPTIRKSSDPIPFVPIGPRRPIPDTKPVPPNRPWRYVDHHTLFYPGGEPTRPAVSTPQSQPDQGPSEYSGDPFPPSPSGLAGFDFRPGIPIAPPPAETKKSAGEKPFRLSEPVVAAQLISRIEPRYPPLAVQIHLQGAVHLHAIISREGRITSLEVLSGHPLFVQSALEAVQQWRYRPTLLNGEAVEVETTITVIFQLQK